MHQRFVIFLLAALTSCTVDRSPSAASSGNIADQPSATARRSVINEAVHVPARYALGQGQGMPLAPDWEAYLATLPDSDRQFLEAANAKYFGALGFESPEELQKMAERGIPLPSELLEARRLTDTELQQLADSGNVKAQMFYADRLIDHAWEASRSGTATSADGVNWPALNATLATSRIAGADPSPFGAYLDGRARYELGVDHAPEYMAGGMLAAAQRGDPRANRLLAQFSNDHPEMRSNVVTGTAGVLAALRRRK